MVDNCYGEFVETIEPTDVGADMCVGSLIKNPGGGLAPIGGYIVGKKELIDLCAYRLTAPGLGKEVGATLGVNRVFFQGFFLAPTVTAGALKGAIFAANVYEKLGYKVVPDSTESRHDIIQAVTLGSPWKQLSHFARVFRLVRLLTAMLHRSHMRCRVITVMLSWQQGHLYRAPQ